MKEEEKGRQHKIIVGGVGRTGSTALMCMLSYLELGTGFGKFSYKNEYINKLFFLEGREEAYIYKENENAGLIPDRFDKHIVDHFIFLQRDARKSSASRIKKHQGGYWMGGLTADTEWKPERQQAILLNKHKALNKYLKSRDIPCVEIVYPDFIKSVDYLYEKLIEPFPCLEKERLVEAFNLIVFKEKA